MVAQRLYSGQDDGRKEFGRSGLLCNLPAPYHLLLRARRLHRQEKKPFMREEQQISPTTLALVLGAGLLGLVFVLSLLAPEELPIDMDRLETLVAEEMVQSIEVTEGSIVAKLSEPVLLDVAGQRYRTEAAIIPGLIDTTKQQAIDRWTAAGVPVVAVEESTQRGLREAAWIGFVVLLLVLGVYHLVMQARVHRRDGSPRQRLDEALADRDAGRISPEEYERRASAISIEM
jgi:hypothetical protein